VDLQSGISRLGPERSAPPAGPGGSAQRSEISPCGEGIAWSSPSEPLGGGAPGVYRVDRGRVERVARSPAPGTDDRPSCAGGTVWFVRRVAGSSVLIGVKDGHSQAWSPPTGSLASVDAHLDARGEVELLLGWVREGRPEVWVTPAKAIEPVRLLAGPAVSPRWLP